MRMLSLKDFIKEAIEGGNGVQNDSQNVWVEVKGEQYTIDIDSVLDRPEKEPFEASYILEDDTEHEAWEELYSMYIEDQEEK